MFRRIFMIGKMNYQPIVYRSSGRLGDFIHQMSVVNELFLKTGRKGLIYLCNNPEPFDNFINTFNDLLTVMKKQIYIYDIDLFNNQKYDIDLSSWRFNRITWSGSASWFDVFNSQYKIDSWGKNKWLNFENVEKYNNCIIICNTTRDDRNNYHYLKNLNNLLKLNNDKKVIFACSDRKEFEFFKTHSNFECEMEQFNTLNDWWSAISSCYLFIGNVSSPLSVAYACHKNNIGILVENSIEKGWFYNLYNQISEKYQWYVSDSFYSPKVTEYFYINKI